MQLAGDVRRRHHDGEGLLALHAVRHERAGLLPLLVELSFDGLRVIHLVHLSGFVFHSRFLSLYAPLNGKHHQRADDGQRHAEQLHLRHVLLPVAELVAEKRQQRADRQGADSRNHTRLKIHTHVSLVTEGVKKRRPPRPKGRSALRGTTFIYTQKDASLRCIGRTLSLQSDLPRALSPNRLAAHGRFSLTAARAYSSFSTGSSYTWIIIGGFRRVVNGFLFHPFHLSSSARPSSLSTSTLRAKQQSEALIFSKSPMFSTAGRPRSGSFQMEKCSSRLTIRGSNAVPENTF